MGDGDSAFLAALSALCGWVYTACWSLSFYPQPLLNIARRSTSGSCVDLSWINCVGFSAYTAATAALLYSPIIRAQYAARNHGLPPTARFNDLVFALHGLLISIVITSQYTHPRLWRFIPTPGAASPTRYIRAVAIASITVVGIASAWAVISPSLHHPDISPPPPSTTSTHHPWQWLDVIYLVASLKLLTSLIKLIPQMLENGRNRSTAGWSIDQVLLDAAGGILSIAQLCIDSYRQNDWTGLTGNPAKLALGNISLVYGAVFMTQHYVLYYDGGEPRKVADEDEEALRERQALLGEERV